MMRDKIVTVFNEMWKEDNATPPPPLKDETVLLETGFDSMAFAVLVTRLDEELGVDPFTASPDAAYPRTFGDFVKFYENGAARC